MTPALPYEWHDTPNLHFLSIMDFLRYCRSRGIEVEKARYAGAQRYVPVFPNLLARTGVFRLRRAS